MAKFTKRNFEQEAEFQIKLLEQKAREDFLDNFSQNEYTSLEIVPAVKVPDSDRTETKAYISSAAKSILEKWMYEHRVYCYPTKAEKYALAQETGLSVQKISNWFINSRRRMLPKILKTEGRNPVNFTISRKKKKIGPAGLNAAVKSDQINCVEENHIIAQSSITYNNANEVQTEQCSTYYDQALQEFIVPYETDDDNSKLSTDQHHEDHGGNRITRGILYDKSTQSKCLFIMVDSPM